MPRRTPEQHLGISREEYTAGTQSSRGKKNIHYEKDGEHLFAKIVNKDERVRYDTIACIRREREFLQRLETTGLVPKVLGIKEYPNKRRYRLLLEHVPGQSLDRLSEDERAEILKRSADRLIRASAEALQKIREQGVYVVDVNLGTFLFDQKEGAVDVKVVDFEFGYDAEADDKDARRATIEFFAHDDPALEAIHERGESIPETDETIARAENYRWARSWYLALKALLKEQEPPFLDSEHLQASLKKNGIQLEPQLTDLLAKSLSTNFLERPISLT